MSERLQTVIVICAWDDDVVCTELSHKNLEELLNCFYQTTSAAVDGCIHTHTHWDGGDFLANVRRERKKCNELLSEQRSNYFKRPIKIEMMCLVDEQP